VVLELRPRGACALAIARLRDLESPPSVLALSEAPHHAEAVEALCTGASGYLAKDTEASTLAGAIRTLHAGEVLMPWFVADSVLAPFRESRAPADSHQLEGEPLTEREVEVLHLVARGLANDEIAQNLVIAASTVKNHVARIMAKLGARNRTHAAVLAVHRRYV
jgi:DNA-binding NarL/FixJ family response regulator